MTMRSNVSTSAPQPAIQASELNATSGGLVKATLGAIVVAGAILTFVWLPAEHGIDPTGVGHVLGLTEMGHIKEQLHSEADADADAVAVAVADANDDASAVTEDGATAKAVASTAVGAATGASHISSSKLVTNESAITQRLDAIEIQLAAIAATVGATVNIENPPIDDTPIAELSANDTATPIKSWRDELEYTLTPGEGIEIKLAMNADAIAQFEWSANGAVLNHDTHGDGDGQSISYEKGRSVPEQQGEITAAFTGNHGWFWRNRTQENVVMTLRTKGDYQQVVLP